MGAASVASSSQHRSAAEQIEHWADIGRKVSDLIHHEALLAINAGLMKITLEETPEVNVDPSDLFAGLERDRDSGALSEATAANTIRYQASTAQPDLLEQVHPNGRVLVGQFIIGEFLANDSGEQ